MAAPVSATEPSGAPAIAVEGLVKRFGDVRAVESVTFSVGEGELVGLLGPNGAGKTTTINMLTGLARPDSGRVRIAGIDCSRDPRAAQRLVGVVPDESNLYPELTGFDNLGFCAALHGMRKRPREERAAELLETFGLEEAAGRKFGGYSKGMKRKLTIAAGIIHRPRILFLDEPTTGLDVASARHIRQLITGLRRDGTTILLTTHYIEEAERLCDRIAFIVAGRIVRVDTVQELLQPERERYAVEIALAGPAPEIARDLAAAFPAFACRQLFPNSLRVEAGEPVRVGPLVRFLEERGVDVVEARRLRPSLEDVFVRITGLEASVLRKEKDKAGGAA
jgi:ABC-2 type transport system ATP-binding protein